MKKVNNYTADLAVQRRLLVKNLNDIGVTTGEDELLDTINEKILNIDTTAEELGDLTKSYDLGENGVTADYYESTGVLVIDGTNATTGYNYIPDYASSTTREFFPVEKDIKYVFLINITGVGTFSLADLTNCVMIYDMTNTVTKVADYGCYCNSAMIYTNIVSEAITYGAFAFAGCKALASAIVISSDSEVTIGANAFANCAELTYVECSNIASLGEYAFGGCMGLRKTVLTLTSDATVGSYVFAGCTSLANASVS